MLFVDFQAILYIMHVELIVIQKGIFMMQKGTLTFFCGKMGAGKSTKSRIISIEKNAVLLSEDDWLAAHYPNQINSFNDFIKFSALIKPFIKSHVQLILNTGTNVVMDFLQIQKSKENGLINCLMRLNVIMSLFLLI